MKAREKSIIIGNVEVTEEEKEVITLNPKKPIQLEPKLDKFRLDLEVCFSKMRWSLDKIEEYNLLASQLEETPWEELEEAEKRMYIERECLNRKIFSREHKCLKINNFRVTESRFNAHITLPKPLSPDKEVYINLRRETFMRTMKKFLKKYEKEKIKMNISKQQFRGYKKLMKRLKDGEFKMCLTDKSNHHAVIGNEEYLEMGREHTKKDKKITLDEAIKIARESDRHTSMMLKIFNLGQDPKQKQRFRESYLNNQNISHKEDLFKDHKKGLKTRPVINGTGSFMAGGGELYSMTLAGIATLKDGKKSVTSKEELMRAV